MDKANSVLIKKLSDRHGAGFSLAIIAVPEQKKSFDSTLQVNYVYALPAPFSYLGGTFNIPKFYAILKKIARVHDVLVIQLPFIGFLSLPFIHKPAVYHICANVLTAASNPVKYSGLKGIVSRSFAAGMHAVYKQLFRRRKIKIIANGKELCGLYSRYDPQLAISSSISPEDIISDQLAHEFKPGSTMRLLFVGRPSLEKGFDTLIEALLSLTQDFKLSIVGFTLDDFRKMLPETYRKSESIHGNLEFKGYLGWDTGLKSVIRENDVALVPSRSEGTPRVILECMSQGTVVIASRVGGIPTIINDDVNGLLVEPGSSLRLAEKIMFLDQNPELRKKLISCGLETARMNTIDRFADQFYKAIEQLANE